VRWGRYSSDGSPQEEQQKKKQKRKARFAAAIKDR
jgi:hypothetical protein